MCIWVNRHAAWHLGPGGHCHTRIFIAIQWQISQIYLEIFQSPYYWVCSGNTSEITIKTNKPSVLTGPIYVPVTLNGGGVCFKCVFSITRTPLSHTYNKFSSCSSQTFPCALWCLSQKVLVFLCSPLDREAYAPQSVMSASNAAFYFLATSSFTPCRHDSSEMPETIRSSRFLTDLSNNYQCYAFFTKNPIFLGYSFHFL